MKNRRPNQLALALVQTTSVAVLLCISANSLAFEKIGKAKMEVAEQHAPTQPGTERHWVKNGKPYTTKVLSNDGETISGIDSTDCEYSQISGTWSPSLSWKNCDGATGTHKIHKIKGSPWPMKVKKKFSFKFSGKSSTGDSWSGVRKCKVKSAVRIAVPAGEFDTYKLTCSVSWETKTYWYSPELGHSIAIKKVHKHDPSKNYMLEFEKEVKL